MSINPFTSEFRRCLVECDVAGVRRIWQHVSPHLPQPRDDDEAEHTIHLARVGMETIPDTLRRYSKAWLAERATGRVAMGVGISINAPEHRRDQARSIRHEMSEAVLLSVRDGLDLEIDAGEISRRMTVARRRG